MEKIAKVRQVKSQSGRKRRIKAGVKDQTTKKRNEEKDKIKVSKNHLSIRRKSKPPT